MKEGKRVRDFNENISTIDSVLLFVCVSYLIKKIYNLQQNGFGSKVEEILL